MSGAPERFGLGISNCRPACQVVHAVGAAEALGAEIAFVAEDVNCRDSFQLCALSATATEKIRIATGVVNPYTRNPTSLAMAVATLDEISEGRAVLGLGTSSPSLITAQMGIPMGKPVGIMREATDVIRALLAGRPVSYVGEHFVYADATLEVQPVQPQVPIYFAAMGPQMLRLAGRIADGVVLNVGASEDYVRWAVGLLREGATAAGRSFDELTVAAWLSVYITEDRAAGLRRAREWLATMLSIPRQGELLLERAGFDTAILPPIRALLTAYPHSGDREAAGREVPVEVAERLALVGTADEVRARVDAYRAAGVQIPVMGPGPLKALYGPGS